MRVERMEGPAAVLTLLLPEQAAAGCWIFSARLLLTLLRSLLLSAREVKRLNKLIRKAGSLTG